MTLILLALLTLVGQAAEAPPPVQSSDDSTSAEPEPLEDESARWYREHPQPAAPAQQAVPMRRALDVGAGYGLAFSTDGRASAAGFTAEVAHVWLVRTWFSPRVYAGTLITGKGSCSGALPCDVGNQIGYAGGQAHLLAPIAYFGPFIDLGFGLSFGAIHDVIGSIDHRYSGVMPHLKLGAGIAFGERNQYEVGLRALDHFTAHSIAGGFMLGLRFALQ